ncbi:hypothetical protein [Blastococcus goldschmidtiae]|uniref:Uncharacterized protein n=1 Tax=Blastococcus goldschmidtiae TaxID=3075546 RepID=A0ABU2K2K1_9ACTN|nr:hypothetical protein [Blastococcus sp. DSM 46792]MDT0274444.1 hypothetical protein [Blastococcus sp. DSM 46792]
MVYGGDLVANTALRLYRPLQWSGGDWLVDVVDEYVQARTTGVVSDRPLDPAR